MPKESYYFSHDYDAQNDPKLQAFISEFKAEGYGIYWAIIEMLHKENDHKLPLKKYVYLAIAKQMLTSAEQIEIMLKYAIQECELFRESDGFFFSTRVLRNIEQREKISEKRSFAGKKGAIAKQNLANAKQILANVSKGKEKKGKENIINKIVIPIEKRIQNFENEVLSHSLDFHPDMLKKFMNYWTEKSLNGNSLKFELQETWDTKKRLNYWLSNENKFQGNNNGSDPKNNKHSVQSRLNYEFDAEKAKQRIVELEEQFPDLG